MVDAGILILRFGLGVIFVAHGLQKVFGLFGGPGINGFSKMLSELGFSPALLWAYLGAYIELLGGLSLLLGLFVRPAALLLFILILIAAYKVHIGKGFFIQQGGFEYALVIACVCLALVLLGGGRYSIYSKF